MPSLIWFSQSGRAFSSPPPGLKFKVLPFRELPGLSRRPAIIAFSLPILCSPGGSEVKASAPNARDLGSIPGSGRSPGKGNGNPLQYSCLENPMDGEACRLQSRGRRESDTTERLHFLFCAHHFPTCERSINCSLLLLSLWLLSACHMVKT